RLARLLEADRLLDGDFVEGIHRHLDVAEFDAGAVRLDPDFHVLVDRPLDGHEDLHGLVQFLPAALAAALGRALASARCCSAGTYRPSGPGSTDRLGKGKCTREPAVDREGLAIE